MSRKSVSIHLADVVAYLRTSFSTEKGLNDFLGVLSTKRNLFPIQSIFDAFVTWSYIWTTGTLGLNTKGLHNWLSYYRRNKPQNETETH